MIVQEQIDNLIFTHSDSGYYIIQNETGLEYMDAVDMIPCEYTYRESENKIPKEGLDVQNQQNNGNESVYSQLDADKVSD